MKEAIVVGVREFRDKATKYLDSKGLVIVTKHEKPTGVYVPLAGFSQVPLEIKRAIYYAIKQDVEKRLATAGISEEEVLADLEEISKRRR